MRALLAILLFVAASSPLIGQQSEDPPAPVPVEFPSELTDISAGYWRGGSGQSTALLQRVGFRPGAYGLAVRWKETDPNTQEIYEEQVFASTSFRITDVATREGGNEIYVAGLRDDGTGLVQRLTFAPRTGGFQIRTISTTIEPIGTAMPNHGCEVVLTGGTFTVPTQPSYGTPTRRLVLGNQIGLVRRLVVDPYGRFLLLLTHEDSKIYRLDLTSSPPDLSLLYSPVEIPELADMVTMVLLSRNEGGHFCVLTDIPPIPDPNQTTTHFVVLRDDDNDGNFSADSYASRQAYDAAGYSYGETRVFWDVDQDTRSW